MFAVVSFGGFLGMAEKYQPIPWASLDYDEDENAYVVDYTKEQLEAAPAGSVDELAQNDGMNFRDRTYEPRQHCPWPSWIARGHAGVRSRELHVHGCEFRGLAGATEDRGAAEVLVLRTIREKRSRTFGLAGHRWRFRRIRPRLTAAVGP
jgi:hypothetical protein